MSLLVDRQVAGRGVHVLIVGVGRCQDEDTGEIIGMARTIERLYGWWLDSDPARMLPGHHLASIDVLAAAETPLLLTGDRGTRQTPRLPTLDALRDAFRVWIGKAGKGVGVLHWSGHGGMSGYGSEAPVDVLLCHDASDEGPHVVHWPRTLQGINARTRGGRICCFVDACRTGVEGIGGMGLLDGPLVRGSGDCAYVHQGAGLGLPSYSYARPLPGLDFEGGPIVTNAVLDALDGYGARLLGGPGEHGACPDRISEAIKHRSRRIAAAAGIAHAGPGPSPSMPSWQDEPILAIPNPRCMLDVSPPDGEALSSLDCRVTRSDDASEMGMLAGPDHFETSTLYGAHDIALHDRSPTTGPAFFNRKMALSTPRQLVTSRR